MEDEPINQNYLIGCDTIEHSPSCYFKWLCSKWQKVVQNSIYKPICYSVQLGILTRHYSWKRFYFTKVDENNVKPVDVTGA